MPLVLKGVTFDVPAAGKVGLVGRTGSGKSSIFLALFRWGQGGAVGGARGVLGGALHHGSLQG